MLFLQSHRTWSNQTSLRTSPPTLVAKRCQQMRIRPKRLQNTFKSSITATIHTLMAPLLHKVVPRCQKPNYHPFQKELANICWSWWGHPEEQESLPCLHPPRSCPSLLCPSGLEKGFLHNTSRQTRTKVN